MKKTNRKRKKLNYVLKERRLKRKKINFMLFKKIFHGEREKKRGEGREGWALKSVGREGKEAGL